MSPVDDLVDEIGCVKVGVITAVDLSKRFTVFCEELGRPFFAAFRVSW
jgi:hypothetical protein